MGTNILNKLIFTSILIRFVIVACQGNEVMELPQTHTLGESIEGRYEVSFIIEMLEDDSLDSKLLGYLDIKNGRYTYSKNIDISQPEQMVERFYFIRNPVGNYVLEYEDNYQSTDILESIAAADLFVSINFYSENGETPNLRDSKFYIMSFKEHKSLSFHASISEFAGWWGITKYWDE